MTLEAGIVPGAREAIDAFAQAHGLTQPMVHQPAPSAGLGVAIERPAAPLRPSERAWAPGFINQPINLSVPAEEICESVAWRLGRELEDLRCGAPAPDQLAFRVYPEIVTQRDYETGELQAKLIARWAFGWPNPLFAVAEHLRASLKREQDPDVEAALRIIEKT